MVDIILPTIIFHLQLLFDPIRPHILYASFRKHENIYCWDLRGDVSYPLNSFKRHAPEYPAYGDMNCDVDTATSNQMTNQKMNFDVDPGGHFLGIGDQVRPTHSILVRKVILPQNGDISL